MFLNIENFKSIPTIICVKDCPACGEEMAMEQLELESADEITCNHCNVTYSLIEDESNE